VSVLSSDFLLIFLQLYRCEHNHHTSGPRLSQTCVYNATDYSVYQEGIDVKFQSYRFFPVSSAQWDTCRKFNFSDKYLSTVSFLFGSQCLSKEANSWRRLSPA
jgi:hypothetical protein